MNEKPRMTRRVLGIGLAWTVLWLAFWAMVASIIGIADPDSIDPGEGPLTMLAVFGPMGLATGILFGVFLSLRGRGTNAAELALPRVAGWGDSRHGHRAGGVPRSRRPSARRQHRGRAALCRGRRYRLRRMARDRTALVARTPARDRGCLTTPRKHKRCRTR